MDDWKPRKITDHFKQCPKVPSYNDTWTSRMNYFHNIAGRVENPDRSLKFKCD